MTVNSKSIFTEKKTLRNRILNFFLPMTKSNLDLLKIKIQAKSTFTLAIMVRPIIELKLYQIYLIRKTIGQNHE